MDLIQQQAILLTVKTMRAQLDGLEQLVTMSAGPRSAGEERRTAHKQPASPYETSKAEDDEIAAALRPPPPPSNEAEKTLHSLFQEAANVVSSRPQG